MLLHHAGLRHLIGRFHRARHGNVAVEFAAAAPILILIAFGSFDYGRAYVEEVRMKGAARAGAQQALYEPGNWTKSTMIERVALEEYMGHALSDEEAASLPVSAASSNFCACPGGTEISCSDTCPDGTSPGRFVRVTLTGAVPLTLPYPWSSDGETGVAGAAVIRVR